MKHKRPVRTVSRFILQIVKYLGLGAVLAYAVAFGLMRLAELRPQSTTGIQLQIETLDAQWKKELVNVTHSAPQEGFVLQSGNSWLVNYEENFANTAVILQSLPIYLADPTTKRSRDGLRWSLFTGAREREIDLWVCRLAIVRSGMSESDRSGDIEIWVTGFPFRYTTASHHASSWFSYNPKNGSRSLGEAVQSWVTPFPQPLPIRFFLAAVLYGGLLWLIFGGARTFRAKLRLRRGRCPRCAYDLRHDFSHGCSECGWRKEHTP